MRNLRGFTRVLGRSGRAAKTAALPEALTEGKRMSECELGEPLDITEVATLIGCSPWSVRNRLILKGLPHFRLRANGKLIFYQNQVVRWIQQQQKKGGKTK